MGRLQPLLPLLAFAALIVAGRTLWTRLGIEPTPTGVHAWVSSLGVWGPLVFVAVVAARHGLALPSALVLTVGGLCFGISLGTALGAIGIVISGVIMFGLGRWSGADWIRQQIGPRFEAVEERLRRAGPALVGLATAYPLGPLTAVHVAAGFTAVRIVPFVVALVLAAPVRAFAYSWFGAQLLDTFSLEFWLALGALTVALLGPLAFPNVRRWLLGTA
jgi:uncharacterized membrane protein YdjX (TVP38/TMEM64 family)